MNRHWVAALLAASAMVAGTMPAMAGAQEMMQRPPHPRPEGGAPRGGPGGLGGPAGRLERSEARPIFHDREAFPENRPGFRPDHAEAPRPPAPGPRPTPPSQPQRDWAGRGDWGERGNGVGLDGSRGGGWREGPRPAPAPVPDRARPDRGPGGVRIDRGNWRDDERRRNEGRNEDRDRWRRNYSDWRDHNDQAYGFAERRAWADQWNRSWRRDRRYDWMGWRSLNRGAYHLPRYYAPYGGYGYQRFSSGVIMEPVFFERTYWLDDPYSYRLPPAYGPYRWVRYYNDAVLVDLRSGLVVDIVYDIFW